MELNRYLDHNLNCVHTHYILTAYNSDNNDWIQGSRNHKIEINFAVMVIGT